MAQRVARLVGRLPRYRYIDGMADNGFQSLQDSNFGKREEIRKTKKARRNAKQLTQQD